MKINFELYKVFYYATKYLNFSETGKHLFISQSAVSQSIKLLEDQLHTKLFFRKNKKISLTPEGEKLFSYIETAFNLIQAGERNLENHLDLQNREIKIAASDTICKYYLLPYFKEYNIKNPEIKLKIINRPSPICMELLEKGAIDLAIVNLPNNYESPNLDVKIIKKIQDVFITGKTYPELSKGKISIHQLAKYPFLLLEKNSTTRRFLETLMHSHGISPEPEIELESIDILAALTKIGLGISFVIYDAVEKEIQNNELFIIDLLEEIPPRYLGLLTNKGLPLSTSTKKFTDLFA